MYLGICYLQIATYSVIELPIHDSSIQIICTKLKSLKYILLVTANDNLDNMNAEDMVFYKGFLFNQIMFFGCLLI